MGRSFEYLGTGEYFLNKTPMVNTLRLRCDKWDLIKLLSFSKAKDIVKRTNGNHQIGKSSFSTLHPIEDFYPRYTKNSRR